MLVSLRHSTANKTAIPPPVAPPIASAFALKKNVFGPPPTRYASTSVVAHGAESDPPAEATSGKEQNIQSETWAEALYDYDSEVCSISLRSCSHRHPLFQGRGRSATSRRPAHNLGGENIGRLVRVIVGLKILSP